MSYFIDTTTANVTLAEEAQSNATTASASTSAAPSSTDTPSAGGVSFLVDKLNITLGINDTQATDEAVPGPGLNRTTTEKPLEYHNYTDYNLGVLVAVVLIVSMVLAISRAVMIKRLLNSASCRNARRTCHMCWRAERRPARSNERGVRALVARSMTLGQAAGVRPSVSVVTHASPPLPVLQRVEASALEQERRRRAMLARLDAAHAAASRVAAADSATAGAAGRKHKSVSIDVHHTGTGQQRQALGQLEAAARRKQSAPAIAPTLRAHDAQSPSTSSHGHGDGAAAAAVDRPQSMAAAAADGRRGRGLLRTPAVAAEFSAKASYAFAHRQAADSLQQRDARWQRANGVLANEPTVAAGDTLPVAKPRKHRKRPDRPPVARKRRASETAASGTLDDWQVVSLHDSHNAVVVVRDATNHVTEVHF